MPSPTPGDIHVNAPLTNLSISYAQNANDFIADKIFPTIPVMKQSDLYWVFDRDAWFRTDVRERAPGTESVGVHWKVSTTPYYAPVYAVHNDIDDQTRANADPAIMLEQTATELVTTQLLRKRDITWSTAYFTTGIWTGGPSATDMTGVAGAPGNANQFRQWDQAGSTPIIDIRTQITNIARVTGYRPNTLVLGAKVWTSLADHPDLLERIKYTERAVAGPDLLASLLDLDRVYVNWVISNSANEGATATYDFAMASGKSALLCYANPNPAPRTVSAGYTFAWTGFLGANAYGARIKSFRMEWLESDRVEGEMAYNQKVIAPDLGVYFTGAVS